MSRPPGIVVPDELKQGQQPYLFREWYLRCPVRRWMEYGHRAEFVLSLVRPGPGRRILDIGCDWGYACLRLWQMGADSWGIDIDQDSIEFGRKLAQSNGARVSLQYANARQLPFPDAYVDSAVSIETIEHVPVADRARVFAEAARVLKPGGLLVISTPSPNGLAELGKRLIGRSRALRERFYATYRDEERVKVFPSGDTMVDILLSPRDLQGQLAGSGLRLVRQYRIVFVSKVLPAVLLGPARIAEWLLERAPLVNRLASTLVYVLERV
jgi:ubiquinone/menaquinone biosynthesis C-methylase UbiE